MSILRQVSEYGHFSIFSCYTMSNLSNNIIIPSVNTDCNGNIHEIGGMKEKNRFFMQQNIDYFILPVANSKLFNPENYKKYHKLIFVSSIIDLINNVLCLEKYET